jgi:hypothetical protein
LTKPLYFYNGSSFELVGPTTPQSPIAYQTSAPTAPATGDLWIDSDGDVDTYNRQLTRYYFVATAAQTTITGTDANGLTLAYVAGSEAVYVNGALQVRGQDYTATNGTSVVMSSALAVNDVVEIFAYTAFTVANAYTKTETDGVAAAAAGLRMVVPTSVTVGSGSGSVNAAGLVTFSGASSVQLNGVFTSTYDNYKVLLNVNSISSTGTNIINLRFGTNGTPNTNTDYSLKGVYVDSAAATFLLQDNASSAYITTTPNVTTTEMVAVLDILNPFISQYTHFTGTGTGGRGYAATRYNAYTGQFENTTSFTDFIALPAANNITGTIAVYGYKE